MEPTGENRTKDETVKPQSDESETSLFARRLYCPEPSVNQMEAYGESSLSYIPWTVDYNDVSYTYISSTTNDSDRKIEQSSKSFLSVSYLDLRRQQNVEFADQKCKEAIEASLLEHLKAKSLFQEALKLVPDHVNSLLGFGKLFLKTGRLDEAGKYFRDVLEVEPDNVLAQQYLKSVEKTQSDRHRAFHQETGGIKSRSGVTPSKIANTLTMRESSAYQDALLERTLALDSTSKERQDTDGSSDDHDDDEDHDSRSRKRKKKKSSSKKRKRKKYKKKRHKKEKRSRRRYDSSSSVSSHP